LSELKGKNRAAFPIGDAKPPSPMGKGAELAAAAGLSASSGAAHSRRAAPD